MSSLEDPEPSTQLFVNSNIVSGLSMLLFDLLLPMIVRCLAQSICTTANVYLVYQKRCAISPTVSRLGSVADGPAGPRVLSRFLSVLIIVVIVCAVTLGFSINGKSGVSYRPGTFTVVQVKDRVVPIDFDRECDITERTDNGESTTGTEILVSRWLISSAHYYLCEETNFTHSMFFAFAFEGDDLNGKAKPKSTIKGGVCVKDPNFKKELVSFEARYAASSGERSVKCAIEDINFSFEDGSRETTASFRGENCDVNLEKLYCYKAIRTSCAGFGVASSSDGTRSYIVLIPDATQSSASEARIAWVRHSIDQEEGRTMARNVAFFRAINVGGDQVANLVRMSTTTVSRNVEMERKKEFREITEIDMGIFIPAVSIIAIITIVLGAVTFVLWFRVIYGKGRQNYNTFSTISELMLLISPRKENVRGRWRGFARIGIDRYSPRIVVKSLERTAECEGSDWPEDEIDGDGSSEWDSWGK